MDIKIINLVKRYDQKTVLKIDQFTFKSGLVYGVIGQNGSGKTTLLRILAGLEEVNSGQISYNTSLINESIMKKITYLSQSPYLLRASVYQNIAYPLKIRKVENTVIHEKVISIMNELQISDLQDQIATSLSGGESQKVALARSLVFDPEVLLLDEPTASIDPDTIEIIEHAILKRNKQNRMTTITISHNLEQVQRMCDNIIFMDKGLITEKVR